MVNVLIVEDQRMMRETMEYYIRQSENYCLAASVANASYAEECCAGSPIDLILMDICTEDNASGFAATEKIKARFPHVKVLIVTSLLDYDCIKTARKVGADSIWFKDASREELMAVVDRTVNGESVFPDRMPEVSVGKTKRLYSQLNGKRIFRREQGQPDPVYRQPNRSWQQSPQKC